MRARSNMRRSLCGLAWIASSLRSLAMTVRPRLTSTHIRPLDLAPAPTRHRLLFDVMRLRLRGDDGDARAPFDIGCESRAKFRVGRRANFVRCVDQQIHPAPPLSL